MNNNFTSREIRSILAGMSDRDRAIFSVYAFSPAKARTLKVSDMRTSNHRYWLRVLRKNGDENWHEIPSWLWFDIINARSQRSTQPFAPVFSSSRHPDKFYSVQELNRKLRRYAELAGVRTDIRIQDLRGVLMEYNVGETKTELVAKPISSCRDYRLHGIGRRSFAR